MTTDRSLDQLEADRLAAQREAGELADSSWGSSGIPTPSRQARTPVLGDYVGTSRGRLHPVERSAPPVKFPGAVWPRGKSLTKGNPSPFRAPTRTSTPISPEP